LPLVRPLASSWQAALRAQETVRMSHIIPEKALVVVADGTGAKFFRHASHSLGKHTLTADGGFGPSRLLHDGPAGKRPPEQSHQETDEATFAKQLAHELYRRAHSGDYAALVLIADPQTLGQMRPLLHKEVQSRVVLEIAKTLTKATTADIEAALHA
jgi:protein required for attachment to host cells